MIVHTQLLPCTELNMNFLTLIFLFSNDNKNDAIQIKTNFYDVQLDFQRDEAFDVMFFHWPTVVCTGSKMHVSWCFFPVIQRWIFHSIDSNFLVWFDENFTPPRKPLFGINFGLVLLTNKKKSLNLCSLSYILLKSVSSLRFRRNLLLVPLFP